MKFTSFTALETRVLFSVSGDVMPTPADPAVVAADAQQISVDVAKMKSDVAAADATLAAARTTRDGHAKALAAQLKSLELVVAADASKSKSGDASVEVKAKAIVAKWKATIGAEELDVHTNAEGETAEERAADQSKLDADRAARLAELKVLEASAKAEQATRATKLAADRAAVAAARKAGEAQQKLDAAAVSGAEKARATVFQLDRKIVESDLAKYRTDGGKVDALKLMLPTLELKASATVKK